MRSARRRLRVGSAGRGLQVGVGLAVGGGVTKEGERWLFGALLLSLVAQRQQQELRRRLARDRDKNIFGTLLK
jgi:hypothetical protein